MKKMLAMLLALLLTLGMLSSCAGAETFISLAEFTSRFNSAAVQNGTAHRIGGSLDLSSGEVNQTALVDLSNTMSLILSMPLGSSNLNSCTLLYFPKAEINDVGDFMLAVEEILCGAGVIDSFLEMTGVLEKLESFDHLQDDGVFTVEISGMKVGYFMASGCIFFYVEK